MSIVREPIIQCENVSFRYGEEEALSDISFSVRAGDYVGLVGSNGSGKTTLLKILLGLLEPTSGRVKLFGKALDEFRQWEKVGYVPQHVFRGDMNFPATVQEVVESGHLRARTDAFCKFGKSSCEAVSRALERAGVSHVAGKRIGELSGGERQRVFIARALVSQPELLVLDEPTTGIDAASEAQFYRFLKDLNEDGLTIILVSHDLEAVAREVKTVLCLNRRLVCAGTTEHLKSPEVLKKMYGESKQMITHTHE